MSWNDVGQPSQRSSTEQIQFLKINQEARVRILSEPEPYFKHFVTTISGRNTVIKCPGFNQCIVCQKDGKPRKREMFLILDRADGQVKLYDAPETVAEQIKPFIGLYGDLIQYDIAIKKLGSTKRTDYQVVYLPKSDPLTNDEILRIQSVSQKINLKELVKPHTPEEIEAILYEKTASKVATNIPIQPINPFAQPVPHNINPQPGFPTPQSQSPYYGQTISPVGQPYPSQKPAYTPDFQVPNSQNFGNQSFGNVGMPNQGKVIYVEPTGEVSNQNMSATQNTPPAQNTPPGDSTKRDLGSSVDVTYFNRFLGNK
jgi:hypothetical protein